MNNWLSIICLAMATFYCQAQLALQSTIKAVTVYNDRAAVSRTARTELAAGEQELVFKDLPYSVDNNSIQLNIKATAPITILDITVSSHNLVGDANQRLQAIENEIKALQKLLAQLTDQESLLSEQNNYIKHIQQSVVGLSEEANRPSLEQIQQVMAFSNNSLAQLSQEAHQLAIKKEQLQSQLRVLETNRSPLLQKINSQVKDVTVKVNLPKAETVTAELTYVTYGARWTPLYDARFNSKEQKLSINYLANVSQQTGEDWKNVKLTLSTAKPSFSGTIPELSPWRVAQYNNIPKNMSGRMMMKKELASSNIVKLSRRDIAKPTPMPIASISASLTNTAFIIAEPTTLLSGNHQQKVMINSLENLQPELTYETVPRLKEAAILRATAKNNSNYPLLAGPLNIIMDGRFITRGNLDITMPTDQLKVNLGADEAINIVFKEVKQFTEKTGFTNSGERVTYDYLITAQNNKNIPVKLVISDHIPVSQNEKINVKLLSPNHIQPDKEGKINWDITLKPMEKREIPVKFTVDYSVNTHVIGL